MPINSKSRSDLANLLVQSGTFNDFVSKVEEFSLTYQYHLLTLNDFEKATMNRYADMSLVDLSNLSYVDRFLFAKTLGFKDWHEYISSETYLKNQMKLLLNEFPQLKAMDQYELFSTLELAISLRQNGNFELLQKCLLDAAHNQTVCLESRTPHWAKDIVMVTSVTCVAAGVIIIVGSGITLEVGTGGAATAAILPALASSINSIIGGCAAVAGIAFGGTWAISSNERATCNQRMNKNITECSLKYPVKP